VDFWHEHTGFTAEEVKRYQAMQMQAGPPHRQRLDLVAVDRVAAVEQERAKAIRAGWQRAVDHVNGQAGRMNAVHGSSEKHGK
jgi:hypothetical protein